MLNAIVWNVDPVIFSIGPVHVHWYGLMWAIGFLVGYELIARMFKHEKLPDTWADNIFIYMAIGTIIGARLGHCLFYGWVDTPNGMVNTYLQHPADLLKIWEGGLSSHGGAIGILIAMALFNRFVSKKGFIWIFDRLVISVAFCGACIRFGNLMNSEIYGGPTSLPWGFIFLRDGQTVPCHPTQLYEVTYCLVALAVCAYLYWRKNAYQYKGLIFGTFLLIVFVTRFLLEFIKNNQEAFEQTMLLNMGQLLSIPFIIWGAYLLYHALKEKTHHPNA